MQCDKNELHGNLCYKFRNKKWIKVKDNNKKNIR